MQPNFVMDLNSKNIQLQFEGYLHTPQLWKNDAIFNLSQFEIPSQKTSIFNESIPKNLRLGKRVELFVFHQLQQYPSIQILVKNQQIQDGTRTVGEIDAILTKENQPIHLEIVYKFYVYDATVGSTALEHWIGPNRRDSLVQKLTKLKEKQFPLLFNKHTQPLLQKQQLTTELITQQVLFKAQLFIPLNVETINYDQLNPNCVKGFYIHFSEIQQFKRDKFFIPTKENWLTEVQTQTNWLSFDNFKHHINPFMEQQMAPLCWLKKENGTLHTFFVVWWDL